MVFILLFQLSSSTIAFTKHTFQQRINHFNTHSNESFNQIYLTDFNLKDSDNKKQILIVLGGFYNITKYIAESKSILDLQKATNAHIFILEHRFFGESKPAGGVTPENRNYLMIHQALADIDYFLEYVQNKYCSNYPNKCSIGLIGSGYAGSLAAWSRVRYPHLTAGSWSSSAPLYMTQEFAHYDYFHASKLEEAKAGCLSSTKKVFEGIENKLDNGDNETIKALKEKFGFEEDQDNVSLLYAISEVLSLPLQMPNSINLLSQYCQSITEQESEDSVVTFYNQILNKFKLSPDSFDPFLYPKNNDRLNRLWLQCNQLGWFHTSSGRLRSNKINIDYFNRVCQNAFGINVGDSTISNKDFGKNDPYLSNAIFTNGENDPYRKLSAEKSYEYMGRFVYTIPNVGPSADIFSNYDTEKDDDSFKALNSDITKIQDSIVQNMTKWILHTCDDKCKKGTCVLSNCICDDMWDGEFCDRRTHTLGAYKIISAVCIIAPTLILLFFGMFVLFCGSKEDMEIDNSRKSYFT